MHDIHFDAAAFRHLLEKDNDEEQVRFLLHHLAVCPGCAAGNGYVLELYRAGALGPRFSTVELDLARSRAEAPGLLKRLLEASPFEERKRLLRETEDFRSWGLCELLCAESVRAAVSDAIQAVELAELAVLLSSLLEEWQPAEELWLHQLRAFAWAHLGSARRVLGELRSAGEAFDRSEEWWDSASSMGDVLGYEVRLLDLKSSLRRAQRRFDEALDLLERALEVDACGTSTARLLIKKAKIVEEQGNLRYAIDILFTAEPHIQRTEEPRLHLCLRHNLLDYLSKAGRHDEARALLGEVRALSEKEGGALDHVRLRWAEGRIAAGLGELDRAVEIFHELQDDLLARGIGFDAALVTLERAALHARRGETAVVRDLAVELLPLFESLDIGREALATLALFIQAVEWEEATEEMVRQVIERFERLGASRSSREE
jgi:tetratricopeptide (TPR) repeat protein